MITRFSPDGNCRQHALDFIFQHLFKRVLNRVQLANATNFYQTILLLDRQKLKFIYTIPWISFISPISWIILFRFYKNIKVSGEHKMIKRELKRSQLNYATFYHLTCKQLYGIVNESWTHCVVGYYNGSIFKLYDPLSGFIEKDFCINAKVHTEQDLDSLLNCTITIW